MSNSSNRSIQTKHIADIAHQRNYISNNAAIRNTADYTVSKNTSAAARPDSGFVTSATNITFTRTTSSPLSGDASFLITKDAANRQGEQVYVPFTIDSADQAKMMTLSFDYAVASGTFVFSDGSTTDSDIIAYVYDVTNATFIEPIGFRLTNNSNAKMSFQTASNSTSYRLLLHVASTSAAAYTLKVDNITLTRQVLASDSLITDWQQYTPTFTNMGSVSGVVIFYRRVGGSLEIRGYFISGTGTASAASISLPTGLVASSSINRQMAGKLTQNAVNSAIYDFSVMIVASGTALTFGEQSTNVGSGDISGNYFASGVSTYIYASVPIQGWATNTTVLSSGEGRVVAARVEGDPASATGGSPIIFPTVNYDTHGAYNTTTGEYTIPVAGYYKIYGTSDTSAAGGSFVQLYKNGTFDSYLGGVNSNGAVTIAGSIKVISGDKLTLVTNNSGNYSIVSSITFERTSGPEQVQAGEIVAASYTASADQSIPHATDVKITYNTKDIDTHGTFDTTNNRYVIPAAGIYQISGAITYNAGGSSRNADMNVQLFKNGSLSKKTNKTFGYSSDATGVDFEFLADLKAGEYVEVYTNQTSTVTLGTYGDASIPGSTYVNIVKIK